MGVKQLFNRRLYQIGAISVADGLFFGITDPGKAASSLFIVAFLLVALSLYMVFLGIGDLGVRYGLRVKHRKRLAMTGTGVVGGLLALQSIGQLSFNDLAVIVPLIALGYFYFSYNKRQLQAAA